jgi:uncharacterized protein (DUF924 family)
MTATRSIPDTALAVLDFWFKPDDPLQHGLFRREWFSKHEAFDAEIRKNFGLQVEAALAGKLIEWDATAEGTLAHLLLLDQFTRNIFRGTAKAFSGDALALTLAKSLVSSEIGRAHV